MHEPTPAAPLTERPCPFITFYSFKGGVGRSMAAINVAGIMASRGFRVLVVDMDLEAPGLSFLANPHASDGEPGSRQPGFVDFILDAVERGPGADLFKLSAEDAMRRYSALYELPEDFRRSHEGSLRIMPAGLLDDSYSARLTRLDLQSLYSGGVGLALIKAFKQIVQDSKLFDYVFVDSRTGFSDESGICTRDLADCLMVVSGLNRQNVEGTTRFLATLRHATEERKPLEVILSPIPNGEDALVDARETQAQEAFRMAWGEPVNTELHIPYHPQLALTEEPHIFRRRRGYLFDAYNKIEQSVLNLLNQTWFTYWSKAIRAFGEKDYTTAQAHFQRVSKLANTQEWVELTAIALEPVLLGDAGAKPIFALIVERASAALRTALGQRIANDALHHVTKAPDLAKVLLERALEADPNNAMSLGNYALLLWKEQKDFTAAEDRFKQALELDPKKVLNLGNYALFLWKERKNSTAAEALIKRALEIDPRHANSLGKYALFLWEEQKDATAAEAIYKQALEADPNDVNCMGNYGRLCLTVGRVSEGIDLVDRALAVKSETSSSPGAIDAECWMYVFCCGAPDRRFDALQHLRTLLEVHHISTGDWDFTGVIQQARATAHPDEAWLPILADVLGGRRPSSALDDWPAWRAATPR